MSFGPSQLDGFCTLQPPPRGSEMTCYGCGEKGHGMAQCPTIDDLISREIVAREMGGRLVYRNGSPICNMTNETYLQAYKWEQHLQGHFVMVTCNSDVDSSLESSDEEEVIDSQSDDCGWLEETDQEDEFPFATWIGDRMQWTDWRGR